VAKFVWWCDEAVQCWWRIVNWYPTLSLTSFSAQPMLSEFSQTQIKIFTVSLPLCFHLSISHFLQIFISTSSFLFHVVLLSCLRSQLPFPSLCTQFFSVFIFFSFTFGFLFVIHSIDVSAKGYSYALIMWTALLVICVN